LKTVGGHTPVMDEFAELLNDKRLQLEFSKQSLAYMSFLDKNKN